MFTKAGKRRRGSSLREEGATDNTDQHGSFCQTAFGGWQIC